MPSSNSIWPPLRKPTRSSGRDGEERAAAYLQERGYCIVQRNVRLPGGELDLVCKDGETIVFVEVKLRNSGNFGSALGAVDRKKRATLRALASDYLQFIAPSARARFDVVAIYGTTITLHKDAF